MILLSIIFFGLGILFGWFIVDRFYKERKKELDDYSKFLSNKFYQNEVNLRKRYTSADQFKHYYDMFLQMGHNTDVAAQKANYSVAILQKELELNEQSKN
jgi:hypothetical protein